MGDKTLKEVLYRLKVGRKERFFTAVSFTNFIDNAVNELGSLEGKFSFEEGIFVPGRGMPVNRDYFFGKPFNKTFYSEKGIYDSSPSDSEVFEDMADNLGFYSKGLNIEIDGNYFKISR